MSESPAQDSKPSPISEASVQDETHVVSPNAEHPSCGPASDEVDLVIAWVAPVGTEVQGYADYLAELLAKPEYCFVVTQYKVIEEIKKQCVSELEEFPHLNSTDYYRTTKDRQRAGDWLREKTHPGFLAAPIIAHVSDYRINNSDVKRRAHIVRSLKHPAEAVALRRAYGPAFILIGAHSTYSDRLALLKRKCNGSSDHAHELISIDADEGVEHGQHTRDLFELCDAYIHHTTEGQSRDAKAQLHKIFDLLFGAVNIAPTVEEYGMSVAFRTAEQSGDLARQVGAAILNIEGEVLATGRNDVPRAHGGVYRVGNDKYDGSDMALGYDPGQKYRDQLTSQVVNDICDSRIGKKHKLAKIKEPLKEIVKKTKLKNLIEYGRSIHAEMDAVTTCARRGIKIAGAQVFVTTYPCHTCARHLIACGISKVVYLEPYPKSLALGLHADSIDSPFISEESLNLLSDENLATDPDVKKVPFIPFVGMSPNRYTACFGLKTIEGESLQRKAKDGTAITHVGIDSKGRHNLRVPPRNEGLFTRESIVTQELVKKANKKVLESPKDTI